MNHRIGAGASARAIVAAAIVLSGRAALAGPTIEYGDEGWATLGIESQFRFAYRNVGGGASGDGGVPDFQFRRNRLLLRGALDSTWGYYFQIEHLGDQRIVDYPNLAVSKPPTGETIYVLDAFVSAKFFDALQFRAGRTKNVSSREVLEGCYDPLSLDRSLFVNTGTFNGKRTRDYGLVMWGNFLGDVLQYRLAVMEGNESSPNQNFRYTGRLHVSLLEPETAFGYLGTYLGKKKVLTIGASFDLQPGAVHSQGDTGSETYSAYSVDAFFEYPTSFGTFTVSGAYLASSFGGAGFRGITEASGLDGEKNGGFAKLGYMLGNVQPFVRVEKWQFAELNGVVDQAVTWGALGVNYYVKGQDLRATLEVSRNVFGEANAANQNFTSAVLQLQARL